MSSTSLVDAPEVRRRRRFVNYPRSHVKGFRRWLPSWRVLVGTFLAGVSLVAGVVIAAYTSTGVPATAEAFTQQQASTVYYADGTEMGKIGLTDRKIVDYADLPDYVGNAVVASEDSSFWTNSGIDPKGLLRAVVTNVTNPSARAQGGSTLTQQYAERYYMNGEATSTDSYTGKFREAILALKITKAQEKTEILGNYLNTIYFGRGAYGIDAASQAYYGIPAAEMSISQAALLAGIIPAPNSWTPAPGDNSYAEGRFTRVVNRMYDQGYITKAEHDEAELPEVKKYETANAYKGTSGYLVNLVKKELAATGDFGDDGDELLVGGYQVTTTIDRAMQKEAVKTANSLPKDADKNVRVALTSIDPTNGELKALYGGKDAVKSAYNNSVDATAQGGSTFKPFTLLAALENGVQLTDRFNGSNNLVIPGWREDNAPLRNFGGESKPDVDLVGATADSINTVYGALNLQIGPKKTAEMAKRLGIKSATIENNPANVLGTAHVEAVELANAYATIADGGQYNKWHIVRSYSQGDGDPVVTPVKPKRVVEADVVAGATYAMTKVIEEGSGVTAKALGRPVAGKTGTSNENKSAWFAAFVPQLTTVVGIYQDNGGTEETITPFGDWKYGEMTGGSWPATAWTQYMQAVLKDVPVKDFPEYTAPRPTWSPAASSQPTETATTAPTEEPEETEMVKVPGGLKGQSSDAASAMLRAVGLEPNIISEYSDQAPGIVLRVQGSSKVPAGSTIGLVISKGPDPADAIPDPEPSQTKEPDPEPSQTQEPDPEPSQTQEPDPEPSQTPDPGQGNGNGKGAGNG